MHIYINTYIYIKKKIEVWDFCNRSTTWSKSAFVFTRGKLKQIDELYYHWMKIINGLLCFKNPLSARKSETGDKDAIKHRKKYFYPVIFSKGVE